MDKNNDIDEKSLLEFIAKAHRNTYAAPENIKSRHRCETPILEGHKDYEFVEGDWGYHDSYAGTSWAPGHEVVFFKGEPVWSMSYQGQTVSEYPERFINEVFYFLKMALRETSDDMPFRGPSKFRTGDFKYRFVIECGDYRYFKGRESIIYKDEEVFFQDVMGTLIK